MQKKKNITKQNLENLANLLKIGTKKSGWLKNLAERIGVSEHVIYGCIRKDSISMDLWPAINRFGISQDRWYLSGNTPPYPMPEETMLPKESTRNPNGQISWSIDPDRFNHPFHTTIHSQIEISPEHHPVLQKVVKILDSGEIDTIEALKMNVDQFARKIDEKKQYQRLISEHQDLKRTIGLMKKRQDDVDMILKEKSDALAKAKKDLILEKKETPFLREPIDPAENG